jgi:mannitol/fructose-specific phosphotransferase system IIA component (Ntr-type)
MNQNEVLIIESILTEQSFSSREEATIMAGEILFKNGYVEKEYIQCSKRMRNILMPHMSVMG